MTDRELTELIRKDFNSKVQQTQVPEALSKENIVAMLSAQATEEKEIKFSSKSKNHSSIVPLRRFIGLAASVIAVIVIALAISARQGAVHSSESPVGKLSPEAIEEYIVSIINHEGNRGDSNQATTRKQSGFSPFSAGEKETSVAEPSTVTSETVPSTKAGKRVERSIELVRSNSQYIFRLVKQTADGNKESRLEIIQNQTLKTVSSIPVSDSYGVCFDIFARGNILILVSRSRSNEVNVRFYDITDPERPGYCAYFEQSGAFVYEHLSDGKLCIITAADVSQAYYEMNGNRSRLSEDNRFVSDRADGNCSFITVIDLDNLNSPVVNYAFEGVCDKFAFSDTGLRLAARSIDGICLYRFTLDGNSLKNVGEYTCSGEIMGDIFITENGHMTFVNATESIYNLTVLNANMELCGTASSSYKGSISDVFIGDKFAFISTDLETSIVNYSNIYSPTIVVPVGADGFYDSRSIMSTGDIIVGEGYPGSDGMAVWSIMTRKGECTSISLDSRKFTADPTRAPLSDSSGKITGFPVISGGKPAYLFFITDEKGSLEAYSLYVYEGSSDDVCLIIGQNLYIISADRVKAVSVAQTLG